MHLRKQHRDRKTAGETTGKSISQSSADLITVCSVILMHRSGVILNSKLASVEVNQVNLATQPAAQGKFRHF